MPRARVRGRSRIVLYPPTELHVRWLHVIDPDDSRAQRLHGTHCFEDVTGPDGGGKSVR